MKPILTNQFTILNEPLLLLCSIYIQDHTLDNGNKEISIVEKNQVILKENQNKERDKDISFSILKKSDQLDNFIKIAEELNKIKCDKK